LVKDAAKFAVDLGVNLHPKYLDPVCAMNNGGIIPSHGVKEVLKECVKEKFEREVPKLQWQGKLLLALRGSLINSYARKGASIG